MAAYVLRKNSRGERSMVLWEYFLQRKEDGDIAGEMFPRLSAVTTKGKRIF
jgi:hypothetical protein